MAWMSGSCFVCGKQSVIHYDFLVEETWYTDVKTVKYIQYSDQYRIAGIARLTLCRECLENTFHQIIADMINPDGSPKPKYRVEVASLYALWHQMSGGIFENRPGAQQGMFAPAMDMARLFIKALGGDFFIELGKAEFSLDSLPPAMRTPAARQLFKKTVLLHIAQFPPELRTALMYRRANPVIDPQFVLWTPTQANPAPFTQTIRPEFSPIGNLSLSYMFSCDYYYAGYYCAWLRNRDRGQQNQIRSLFNYYQTYLRGY